MGLLQITVWELMSLIGLVQAVSLLVYMLFRSGRIKNASVSLLCFGWLACAFLADLGARSLSDAPIYPLIQDYIWLALPMISVLLIVQVALIDRLPDKKTFNLLLLLPAIGLVAIAIRLVMGCGLSSECVTEGWRQVFNIIGVIFSCLALLWLWLRRDVFVALTKEKHTKSDRYWVILALILINCGLIFSFLSYVSGLFEAEEVMVIRNILGCGLVYLSSASLFRIYPQALKVAPKIASDLNQEELILLKKIEDLLILQKVYQEPSYNRSNLAKELGVSEAAVSKIVNAHFGKSVPQMLNEKRIEDAQRLLIQTNAGIAVVSEQVGFNSLPSFNRVFKEIVGMSPSEYRQSTSTQK